MLSRKVLRPVPVKSGAVTMSPPRVRYCGAPAGSGSVWTVLDGLILGRSVIAAPR